MSGLAEPGGVLMVCLSRSFGGGEIRVLTMARGLSKRRGCTVATLTDSPLAKRLREQGGTARGIGRRRADPGLLLRLIRLIRSNGYAVVDAHNPQSHFWGVIAARLAGVRPVCTMHQVSAKATGGWWKPGFYTFVVRLSAALGAEFIAVSQEIVDWLGGLGISPDRIHFSANGLADDWVPEHAPTGLRAALGWEEAKVVGIVGRLVAEKGHDNLFAALERLRKDHADVRCLVVGDGPEGPRLRSEATRLGLDDIVHFAGYREDIAAVLEECDVLCLPSLSEGFPYIAIEAAWLGRPAVLSKVGDIPAFFEDGRTARLIEPDDTDDLVVALKWILDNPDAAKALGQAAKDMFRRRLSASRMIEETLGVYDGCPGHRTS